MVRKIKLAIYTGISITIISIICASGQAYLSRARGDTFLSEVRQLRVGQSTLDDVLRIRANFRNYSSVESHGWWRRL
jgi:hypothetical protein